MDTKCLIKIIFSGYFPVKFNLYANKQLRDDVIFKATIGEREDFVSGDEITKKIQNKLLNSPVKQLSKSFFKNPGLQFNLSPADNY